MEMKWIFQLEKVQVRFHIGKAGFLVGWKSQKGEFLLGGNLTLGWGGRPECFENKTFSKFWISYSTKKEKKNG